MIRTQLRVYYGLRGLRGKGMKQAVKRDVCSLTRQGGNDNKYGIAGALFYRDSEEGSDYWRDRNDCYPSEAL